MKKASTTARTVEPSNIEPHSLLGWTNERQTRLVDSLERIIIDSAHATKKTYHTHQGELRSVSEEPDHMVRLRAAELIGQVTGLRHQHKDPVVNITLQIQTPDWAMVGSRETIQITESRPAEGGPAENRQGEGGVKNCSG